MFNLPDYSLNGPNNPAPRGSEVFFYATGLGAMGQAPDLMSGVAQVNILIPNDATTGVVPLTLVVNGVFSPSGVTISVK